MSEKLQSVADKMASALRNLPCTCKRVGDWPIFQRTEKAVTCARCDALACYDALNAIVQRPGGPQCTHAYHVQDGRCVGCGNEVSPS